MAGKVIIFVSNTVRRINDTTLTMPAQMLRIGMFVCRLDRPWLGTPFLMQGFLIQSQDEVQKLQALCDHVYVDTAKSLTSFKKKEHKRSIFGKRQIDEPVIFSPNVDRDLAKTGIRSALPAYSETAKSLRTCFAAYAKNQLVNSKQLESQVDQCLNAVIQNTSAMAWLSRVKSHNNYTNEHSMHVSLLAMVFAVHCGWSREEAKTAGLAGLLFDIGKTKVPKQILNKPGPLSESEWAIVQDHPKWSRYFLEKSGFRTEVVNAAYYHHEQPNGKGYPVHRVGNQAPILARLIHILDAYDAMISYRPYAQQRTVFEASKVLYRGRNSEFDAELVDQLIAMLGVYPIGTIVELTSGEIAVVIGQNNDSRLLPKVAVVCDRNKSPVKETFANLKNIVDEAGAPRVRIKNMLHDGSYGIYMRDYTRQLLVS